MKKSLFYLFALICSMSLLTSCDDDDEDTTWQKIPTEGITSENTTINGKTATGAAMLKVSNANTGILRLTDMIYGNAAVDVEVALTKVSDNKYTFTGTKEATGGILVKATGEVTITEQDIKTRAVVSGAKLKVTITTEGYGVLSGVYQNDSLAVTVLGVTQSSKAFPVTLTATSATEMTLNFSKIVNIANNFTVNATYVKSGNDYTITGAQEFKPGYMIHVTGTLSADNVLTLSVTGKGYGFISSSYSAFSSELTYNEKALKSGSVNIEASSETAAVLFVKGIIPGAESIEIPAATLALATDGTYTVTGAAKTADYEISFKGTVSPLKKMVGAVTYKNLSPLVGKWGVKMTGQGAASIFKFKTATGSFTVPSTIVEMLPAEMRPMFAQPIPDAQFTALIQGLLGQYISQLKSIEFTGGGDILITYIDLTTKKETSLNILKYSIKKNGQVYAIIDLMAIMGMLPSSSAATTKAWDPSGVLTEGIPLNFKVQDGMLNIWLDRDVTIGLVEFVGTLLPIFSEQLGPKAPMIIALVGEISKMLATTTEFEVGLVMTK